MRVVHGTDIGNGRKINQDYYISDEKNKIFIIADGIGGYANGEIASTYASERLYRRIKKLRREDFEKDARQIIYQVNGELVEYCNNSFRGVRMGTTMLCLKIFEDDIGYVSVGDTNAYGIKMNMIEQLNEAHIPSDKENEGEISSALGPGCLEKIDSGIITEKYDYIVLCTDGLNKFVDAEKVLEIMREVPFDDVASALIREALKTDGGDNISVIVIKFD